MISICVLFFNLLLTITLLFQLPEIILILDWPGRVLVQIWPDNRLTLPALVLLLLGPMIFLLFRQRERGRNAALDSFLYIVEPLAFAPLALMPTLMMPWLPVGFPSNTLFYLPVFLLSLVLYRLYAQVPVRQLPWAGVARDVLVACLAFGLTFWLLGWYFGATSGEHLGDEGHYLIQARSLSQDHDLDLLNNYDEVELQRLRGPNGLQRMHISAYAKNGHYYSWHPFGLPLLLAPAVPYGIVGRHLVLGALAGLGGAGILLLCFLLGAGRRASVTFTLLFCFSTLWGIYAFRALPETAGATFLIWLFAGLLLEQKHPWTALFLVSGCAVALPWLHTRFAPLSVLGAGFYLWSVLRNHQYRHSRWQRIVLFVSLSGLGGLSYLYINSQMFGGSAYPIQSTLFSYPPGMWKIFVNWRSVTYMVPMLALLFAVTCRYALWGHRERFPAIMALSFLVAVTTTSCSYAGWGGGSSPIGRYLLVVVPLFVPFGAAYFESAGNVSRWFFLFTGLISCAFFVLVLCNLPQLQRYFVDPRGNLAFVVPSLHGLANPFVSVHDLYGIFFYVISFALIFLRKNSWKRQLFLLGLLCLATWWNYAPENIFRNRLLSVSEKKNNIMKMEALNLEHGQVFVRSFDAVSYQLDDIFINRLDFYVPETIGSITTERLDPPVQKNLISQPRIPRNDWKGRGYRWANLINSFSAPGGDKLFCLQGRMEGRGRIILSVAELAETGSHTALEQELFPDDNGMIKQCFSLQTKGLGDVFLLARIFAGEGQVSFDSLAWYPVGERFIRDSGLRLPAPIRTETTLRTTQR